MHACMHACRRGAPDWTRRPVHSPSAAGDPRAAVRALSGRGRDSGAAPRPTLTLERRRKKGAERPAASSLSLVSLVSSLSRSLRPPGPQRSRSLSAQNPIGVLRQRVTSLLAAAQKKGENVLIHPPQIPLPVPLRRGAALCAHRGAQSQG